MKAYVVTVSDTRDEETDASGDLLVGLLTEFGAPVMGKLIVPDERSTIRDELISLCDGSEIDLVITTGGTGLGPRDVTPEATLDVIEREAQGIAEWMRHQSVRNTPMAMLSRGICGVRGKTLILNLPGSTKAVDECFEAVRPVLDHAIKLVSGDTSHDDKA